MRVDVKLFAGLAQRAGARSLSLELPAGATLAAAEAALREKFSGIAPVGEEEGRLAGMPKAIWPKSTILAVNATYASAETILQEGDVLAVIPPVSGG